MRLRCDDGGQEEGCMSASTGIMLLLLLSSPRTLLELACSVPVRPFILTWPLSCTPAFISPGTAHSHSEGSSLPIDPPT